MKDIYLFIHILCNIIPLSPNVIGDSPCDTYRSCSRVHPTNYDMLVLRAREAYKLHWEMRYIIWTTTTCSVCTVHRTHTHNKCSISLSLIHSFFIVSFVDEMLMLLTNDELISFFLLSFQFRIYLIFFQQL